jgi:hypothetical protein
MTGCWTLDYWIPGKQMRNRCRLCHTEIQIEMLAKPGAKKNRLHAKRFFCFYFVSSEIESLSAR